MQSNLNAALREIEKANKNKVQILVFPELFLSGYTCGDLFLQTALQDACKSALTAVCRATENSALVIVLGLPLKFGASLYNCAAVVQNGMVVAVIPKTYIPNYNEYYEKRWFASGDGVNGTIKLNGQDVPFGQTLGSSFGRRGARCGNLWKTFGRLLRPARCLRFPVRIL